MNRGLGKRRHVLPLALLLGCAAAAGALDLQQAKNSRPRTNLSVAAAPAVTAAGPLEVIRQLWNPGDSTWTNSTRTTYVYALFPDLPSQQNDYVWSGSAWVDDTLRYLYYNGNARLDSSRTSKMVEGTGWVKFETVDVTWPTSIATPYISQKKCNLKLMGISDQWGDALRDSSRVTIVYNSTGWADTETIQSLNLALNPSGNLVNRIKFYIKWNQDNKNTLQRVYVWDRLTNNGPYQWIPVVEHIFTYNADMIQTSWTVTYKDPDSTTYANYRRELYHINSFYETDTLLKQDYYSTGWVNTARTVYGFTSANGSNMVTAETKQVPGLTGAWENSEKTESVYDTTGPDPLLQMKTKYYWDGTGWERTDRELYSYTITAARPAAASRSSAAGMLDCFSSSKAVVVQLKNPAQRVSLAVYDMKGSLVKVLLDNATVAKSSRFVWDGRDMNGAATGSGTYLIRLKSGSAVFTHQAVLAR